MLFNWHYKLKLCPFSNVKVLNDIQYNTSYKKHFLYFTWSPTATLHSYLNHNKRQSRECFIKQGSSRLDRGWAAGGWRWWRRRRVAHGGAGGVGKGQFVFHLTCAVCTDSTPGPPFLLSPSFPPTCSFNLSSLTTSPIKIGQLLHKHWRSGGDGCEEQERECGGWEKELLETDGYAERR